MEKSRRMEGFIFKPSDEKKKPAARQRGPALHQTLVSSGDPLRLRIYLRENVALTERRPSIALLCLFRHFIGFYLQMKLSLCNCEDRCIVPEEVRRGGRCSERQRGSHRSSSTDSRFSVTRRCSDSFSPHWP